MSNIEFSISDLFSPMSWSLSNHDSGPDVVLRILSLTKYQHDNFVFPFPIQ
jgi:hypothetical protein